MNYLHYIESRGFTVRGRTIYRRNRRNKKEVCGILNKTNFYMFSENVLPFKLGVNYFDTSPVYGPSEEYYGKALGNARKKIFLATKTHDRTRDGSLKLLEKSLKRLKTDYVDLWQIHHLDSLDDVKKVTADDGALQALLEMQEEGVVKHLGFTGHEDQIFCRR